MYILCILFMNCFNNNAVLQALCYKLRYIQYLLGLNDFPNHQFLLQQWIVGQEHFIMHLAIFLMNRCSTALSTMHCKKLSKEAIQLLLGFSGISFFEGARGQGMAGCPIDQEVMKFEVRNAHESLRRGVQGQNPWWESRGRSPQKLLCFSMQKQQFSMVT